MYVGNGGKLNPSKSPDPRIQNGLLKSSMGRRGVSAVTAYAQAERRRTPEPRRGGWPSQSSGVSVTRRGD
jgi:hypothetical protein